jgi:LysR family transcriptional regulator, low CO2-responsive transcriptional regulator
MNYTLHQLQVFLKIAQTQSITKASQELFLSQPAVSIQLKNFQEQFDIPLTEIIKRRLYVTDFGKEIAVAAENILNEVYKINYKTMMHKKELTGRLKLSIVSTAKYVMPYFVTEFLNTNTGVDLVMEVTNKAIVMEHLNENITDFALIPYLPEDPNLSSEPLMENKLYLIGKNNAIKDSQFKMEELCFLYREDGSSTRALMEKFIEKNKISVRKKIEMTSNEAVKQAIISGMGYSIMPLIGLKNEIKNEDLGIVPMAGLPIITQWNLVWHKNKKFSPCAEAYLQYVKDHKNQIIKNHFSWTEGTI